MGVGGTVAGSGVAVGGGGGAVGNGICSGTGPPPVRSVLIGTGVTALAVACTSAAGAAVAVDGSVALDPVQAIAANVTASPATAMPFTTRS